MNNAQKTDETVNGEPEDGSDLSEPPQADIPRSHPIWPAIAANLRKVYDPEIPVNLYELGLIYKVEIKPEREDGKHDIFVQMSLTSPACPVAHEMPGRVMVAILQHEKAGNVDVELIWDPPWNPAMMSEAARYQLDLFYY